jgi:anti-sigma regulatory factor (Ser/Thr protein kinase)
MCTTWCAARTTRKASPVITWESGDIALTAEPPNDEHARPRGRWQRTGDPRHKLRSDTLLWTRRFAGTPEQVGPVRRFVASLFADGDADEAIWVASELATNAISYSRSSRPGGSFEVQVMRGLLWADVRVVDAGGDAAPTIVKPEPGDDLAERGRGLYAIGFVAMRYGTFVRRDGRRVVWVRLPAAPQAIIGTRT